MVEGGERRKEGSCIEGKEMVTWREGEGGSCIDEQDTVEHILMK